ncbi:MAG: hypothetical protein IJN28_02810, partial [Selenomonadales bacterium]|nr:hypothetical protein [Selenomonadales bacterium]
MKKNLAKHITLGIMVGTMLMGSSVALAGAIVASSNSLAAGNAAAMAEDSIVIGFGDGTGSSEDGSTAFAEATNSVVIGARSSAGAPLLPGNNPTGSNSVVIGADSHVNSYNNVAVGAGINSLSGSNNVILGYGSSTGGGFSNVVSVGSGVAPANTTDPTLAPQYRRIINVADGVNDHDAATVGQLNAALANVSGGNVDLTDYYTKTEADASFIKATQNGNDSVITNDVVIDTGNANTITLDADGITVGDNSTHMDEEGFYASDNGVHTYDGANAAMMKDGRIKGAGGAFTVDTSGNVTATNLYTKDDVDGLLDDKANAADVYTKTEADSLLDAKADAATTLAGYGITDAYTKTDIDSMIGGSTQDISALESRADAMQEDLSDLNAEVVKTNDHFNAELQKTNDHFNTELGKTNQQVVANAQGIAANSSAITGLDQRVTSLDGRVDKVGAGAAALAAL